MGWYSEETYTITTASVDEFEDVNGADQFANKTYHGFRKILQGMFTEGFSGIVQGEEVIFIKQEIAEAVQE